MRVQVEEIQLTYQGCPRLCDVRRVEMMVDIVPRIHMCAISKPYFPRKPLAFFYCTVVTNKCSTGNFGNALFPRDHLI